MKARRRLWLFLLLLPVAGCVALLNLEAWELAVLYLGAAALGFGLGAILLKLVPNRVKWVAFTPLVLLTIPAVLAWQTWNSGEFLAELGAALWLLMSLCGLCGWGAAWGLTALPSFRSGEAVQAESDDAPGGEEGVAARRPALRWWLGGLGVTILAWCCNVSGSWWALNAPWYSVLATLVYLVFWAAFTHVAGGRGRSGVGLLVVAILHAVSALCSVLARLALVGDLAAALSGVAVLGALLNPFAAGVVFYGFSAFAGRNWTGMYVLCAVVSVAWVVWCAALRRKR